MHVLVWFEKPISFISSRHRGPIEFTEVYKSSEDLESSYNHIALCIASILIFLSWHSYVFLCIVHYNNLVSK